MSWFTSLFTPPPLASPSPTSSSATASTEKRILEEQPAPAPSATSSQSTTTSSQTITPDHQPANPNRNKIVFAAGLSFFGLSLLLTRRAFARRRPNPKFYTTTQSHSASISSSVSGPMEAVEALNLATVNVLSLAMMGVGGTMWYLNINSLEEGRRFIRGGLGVDGSGREEKEVEEDFEEWMATVMQRKERKEEERSKGER